ncbi:hypothetical protein Rcae01_06306 [Novipirellula caenicola]|uniref:Uncharacterized protein n=1 Tax=Novipirellula caenicola TaxID=1536901 RepID=A0ABP9W081_9BACT
MPSESAVKASRREAVVQRGSVWGRRFDPDARRKKPYGNSPHGRDQDFMLTGFAGNQQRRQSTTPTSHFAVHRIQFRSRFLDCLFGFGSQLDCRRRIEAFKMISF